MLHISSQNTKAHYLEVGGHTSEFWKRIATNYNWIVVCNLAILLAATFDTMVVEKIVIREICFLHDTLKS